MVERRHKDDSIHERDTTGTVRKRRGILAAAGAVMIGILAKQGGDPAHVGANDGNFLRLGELYDNFGGGVDTNNNFASRTGMLYTGAGIGGATGSGFIVSDSSTVFGQTHPAVLAGVAARGASGAMAGVQGDFLSTNLNGYGVAGKSLSTTGAGVHGHGAGSTTGTNGIADAGTGVYGQSSTGYGVLGYSTGGSASMSGISTNANIPAFAGGNSVVGGLAASFTGTVFVNGSFIVQDMTQKHGLLKHPDGSHRLMYTVEAPESWAEDFGTGNLVGGKAEVKLDADFAALIQTDDYHVFLTPHADTNGLHIAQRGPASFMVQEHKGGTVNLTFSWRVVAKPKSDKKVERLGRFAVPNIPFPDVAKLLAPGDMPLPPAPPKKP